MDKFVIAESERTVMINIDNDYIVKLRREIHMYPEVDYDLPKTIAVVKRELDAMDVPYTEKYGQGSLAGYINPDKTNFTIGIRADMDALRMTEANDCEYRSRHEGMMHACGHDAHTAILIATAKALKEMEGELACRVKLIFQPSEEGVTSGAIMMIENGVLDDVDIMLGLHVGTTIDTGKLGVCPGVSSASSRHFKIEVGGKSIHATTYHKGIDALAIAVKMYDGIQSIFANEVNPKERVVCRVTKLHSGTAQNIVPDYALMQGTIRTLNVPVSEHIHDRIQKLAKSLSDLYETEIKVHAPLKSTCVYNNPYLSELMMNSMEKVVGKENVVRVEFGMGSEDFSRFTDIVPSVFFRLGIRNEAKGINQLAHQVDFKLDEDALFFGAQSFVQFVLDNQNGVDMEKAKASDER